MCHECFHSLLLTDAHFYMLTENAFMSCTYTLDVLCFLLCYRLSLCGVLLWSDTVSSFLLLSYQLLYMNMGTVFSTAFVLMLLVNMHVHSVVFLSISWFWCHRIMVFSHEVFMLVALLGIMRIFCWSCCFAHSITAPIFKNQGKSLLWLLWLLKKVQAVYLKDDRYVQRNL